MSYYADKEIIHLSNGETFEYKYKECPYCQKEYQRLFDENLSLQNKIHKLEAEIKYLNQTLR